MKASLQLLWSQPLREGFGRFALSPGANGQGETIEAAKASLKNAVRLIFEDRSADMRRGLPEDALQTTIAIE
jgi:predicted RNase H-like HicB family nuclease